MPQKLTNDKNNQTMQSRVRSRHETINKRFKQWRILSQTYYRDILKHADVFRAVTVITQFSIMKGERLFDAEYSDELADRRDH